MCSPTRLLQPHHIIRLTGFAWKPSSTPSSSDIDAFTAHWRHTATAQVSPGLVYRELCQQVPEWSQKAAAEIEHPIPFSFLEYAVFQPGTDLSRYTAPSHPNFATEEGLFTVAFRFVNEAAPGSPKAVMFNLFEVNGPPDMQQGFLMNWPPRGEFKSNEPGTFSAVLHERLLPDAHFAAFNRSEVLDADTYAAGIDRFEKAFPRAQRQGSAPPLHPGEKPPVASHLGLFRIVASIPSTMKAAAIHQYGPPDVLVYQDVPLPAPGPGQIRIRVKAISINPLDVKMRSGEVQHIYPPWFPDVLGYSVSGIVDALGAGVSFPEIGAEVYGINNPITRHGYAEYVVGPAPFYYPKPPSMSFPTAASAPSVFATAHGALFGRANLQSGQRVLIHGGSGVIGSCAVQLARQAGAYVIATASTKNVEQVKQLGAHEVIDYKAQRFEDIAKDLDLVIDTVGGETRDRSWGILKPGGTLASLLPPPPDPSTAAHWRVNAFMVHGHPNIAEILPEMTRRLTTGELQAPEIAAVFPLQEAAAAHASFEATAPRGRIILEVA